MPSAENRVNRSVTKHEPFLVDGRARGFHGGRRILARDVYEVYVSVGGLLPELEAETIAFRASGLADRPEQPALLRPGVRQSVDAVAGLVVFSNGDGFAHALLDAPQVAPALAALGDRLQRLKVAQRPARRETEIAVTTAWAPPDCIALGEALARAADDIVARALSFPRVFRRGDDDEMFAKTGPSAAAVEEVLRSVTEKTSWLAGHAARRGDAVEARVMLVDSGGEYAGVLRVRMLDASGEHTEISLEGELPFVAGAPLYLAPERGVHGFLASLFEEKLGDRALDDAFLVRGNLGDEHIRSVLSAREALLALGNVTVEFGDGRLAAIVPRARRMPRALQRVVDDVIDLWRAAVIGRHGRHGVVMEPSPSE